MKLAFCLPKYFPYGGLQINFMRIAQELHRRGHSIVVYTLAWDSAIPEGIEVHIIKVRALRNHARTAEFIARSAAFLAGGNFDGVIGFMKMPGLDIYYAADPCYQARIRRERSAWYRLRPRYRRFVKLEKAVFGARAGTRILALSEPEIARYRAYYQTPETRFHLLPPGISRSHMAPDNASAAEIRAALRREYDISDGDKLLLAVGSGFATKGLDRSLKALASLPDNLCRTTRLFVIGDGKTRRYRRLAKRLGIAGRLFFLGGRAQDELTRFFLAADLLIHPARSENTGNVLLEAMVAGLPVLATGVCGYAFHIERADAGIVIPAPFSQSELNAALAQMLNSARRRQWSDNGIAYGRSQDLYSRTQTAAGLITGLLNKT